MTILKISVSRECTQGQRLGFIEVRVRVSVPQGSNQIALDFFRAKQQLYFFTWV